MSDLADKDCVPCRGGVPPMGRKEAEALLKQLPGWTLNAAGHLEKAYDFPDFAAALAFVNRLGAVAEEQDHHPDIRLSWGKAVVEVWTHKIDGLTESDFILAAKADYCLAAGA